MEQQLHKPHRKSKEKKKHTGGKAYTSYCLIFVRPEIRLVLTVAQRIPRLLPSPIQENYSEPQQDPRM